jgi:hypothetical protein
MTQPPTRKLVLRRAVVPGASRRPKQSAYTVELTAFGVRIRPARLRQLSPKRT